MSTVDAISTVYTVPTVSAVYSAVLPPLMIFLIKKKRVNTQPFLVARGAQAVAVHIDHRYSDRLRRLEMKCNISENTQVDV